ncbi:MAG: histidine kinase N-terminal 7TM domain-containing protein [Halobacteriaceae archaeon]
MAVSPSVAVWVLCIAALVALVVAALAWRNRERPAAPALAVAMVAEAWWAAGYAAELLAGPETTLLWANLQWFGSVWVAVAWFVFALEYTGKDQYVNARSLAALSVVPTLSLLLVWTNSTHGLVRRGIHTVPEGSLTILQQTFGPGFWLAIGYGYALAAVGSGLFLLLLVRSPSLFGAQAVAVLVAAAAPAVGNVLYLTGTLPWPWFDPTPVSFAVSGVAGVYAIRSERLFERTSVPQALGRSAVVDGMDDGVVVADADGRIVDVNPAARECLGVSDPVGRQAAAVVPGFDEEGAEDEVIVSGGPGEADRYLDVRASMIRDHHDRPVGTALVLRDVTDRHYRRQQLSVLNRALRHNIRNEVSVIEGFADLYRSGDVDGDRLASVTASHAGKVLDMAEKARTAETVLSAADANRDPVAVGETVRSAVEDVAAAFPDVTVEMTEAPAERVQCRWLLGPVVENLVENGAEHNTAADPWVRIAASADADTVTVTVSDNGPGIPKMEADVVRDRGETPTHHGQGIGLWLVAWGVDRMGGEVSFERASEGGTVVTVTMPRADEAEGS